MLTLFIILFIVSAGLNVFYMFIVVPDRNRQRESLVEIIVSQACRIGELTDKVADTVARCNAVIHQFIEKNK